MTLDAALMASYRPVARRITEYTAIIAAASARVSTASRRPNCKSTSGHNVRHRPILAKCFGRFNLAAEPKVGVIRVPSLASRCTVGCLASGWRGIGRGSSRPLKKSLASGIVM